MDSFISKVVKDVISKNTTIKNCVFVLPSQRACVFLKKELVDSTVSSTFLPKIISIENYIQELAEVNLIDTTQLLFEFYSIYKENLKQDLIEPFETFSQWATIALHDFNEIDSYLVNSKDLFSNLKDVKKIEYWFQDKTPSKLAVNYLQFFEHLNTLYNSLYKKLKKNKFGYQGLIYREAVANLERYIVNNKDKHVVLIGFNALNKAEEIIFQELLNNKLASIYWDSNPSLFENTNEAGVFLRKYKKEWAYYKTAPFLWIDDTVLEEKNIEFIGAPKNITQIKYAGELLSKLENHKNTALVLADENLLALALNSLPNSVKNINITMGYPLKDIPFSNLFEKLFKLYLNQQKFNKQAQLQFYYKDVLNFLNDPFLNKLHGELLQKIIAKLKSENTIFLSKKMIENCVSTAEKEQLKEVLLLFDLSTDVNTVIKQCSNLTTVLKNYVDGVDKEYLYRFYTVFKQLETLNKSYNHISNLKTLTQFYNQLLSNEKLSFQGEPLKGLQLMGMLETRALDFETIIVTSVNEGVLPGSKNENSFLPFDVKKYFKMPTYQEKDAIFSYHFQHLLQRAKNVYLIYNTETDGYGAGEKSRFLTQLEINNPTIKNTIINPKVQKNEEILLQVEKTPEVIEKLKTVFEKGISPSALATYIYNPISFYEQKVLEIRDDDEVEETIAANTMGSVIHDVLEQLYTPFIGAFVLKENIVQMQQKIETLLIKFFEKHYKKGNIETGKNKLIFEVCKNHINRFLKQELQLVTKGNRLKIIALEAKLNCEIPIEGIDFPINLRGIVDRIDELNGCTRIIDYKTGKVEARQLKMHDFSVISEDYKYTKAMQVMLYSYMYTSNLQTNLAELESGIISFKNLNAGFLKMNFSEKSRGADTLVSEERIQEFMDETKNIIREILNSEIPFIQNQDLPF
ncbi:PD-(D/E)XK nuclease family protein [Lutibacter sp. A64]|uniref:PD-(D/E)XK nuclease family protein n=1 Tax=Lutibacter sp. A64 TaxID=2918526 RepID=UPI001F064ADB|nr:PD-(D/E)XK nuclease family protein [Lutibacter sp. A64]UMB52976.1 PD-(D/E)XK nuclease family protein [Lutibacter sp. A64]